MKKLSNRSEVGAKLGKSTKEPCGDSKQVEAQWLQMEKVSTAKPLGNCGPF